MAAGLRFKNIQRILERVLFWSEEGKSGCLGIYAYAKEKGGSFEDDYIALLRDTGRMTVEELAKKHLNADLTKPEFWESAIGLCVEDVKEFQRL